MMLWTFFALMTVAAMLAVLWPLRTPRVTDGRDDNDVAVYRDQLDEVERDRAAGLIGATEAEAARLEVSRRLLAAGAASSVRSAVGDASPRPRRWAAAATLVMLPLGAVALYLAIGSPALPGQPLSARIAGAHGDNEGVESAFARVEAHLAEHPEDGRGWEVIAPVYLRLGRYDDAVRARSNALRLLGVTAQRKADLGEAMVAAADGKVTPEAKAIFDEAIRLDPADVSARFYQGLAAEQDGSPADAARIWRALLAAAPEGARWIEPVRRALARVDPAAAGAAAAPGQSPPASAAAAPAEDKMIRDMVARLAARLRQDGSDVDGWIQLVRSYRVLGDSAQAAATVAAAKAALATDAEKLRRLDEGVKALEAEASSATPAPAAPAEAKPAPAVAANQDATIIAMVERLAARLRQDGSSVESWLMLLRSYRVLGEADQETAALADARRALAGDADKLRRLDAGIKALNAELAAASIVAAPRGGVGPGHPPLPEAGNAAASPPAAPAAGTDQMIRGMVDRLSARLRQDGSDVDGWVQLVRSYNVLGEPEQVRTAIADARRALAGDPDKLRRFDDGVKTLGIGG